MKHSFFCLLLFLSCSQAIMACDVCGSSSGNQSLGLLPQMNNHFVGLQYQYNNFDSRHIPLSENQPVQYATEHYHTIQVWGRYCVGKRWQFFGFLPYRYNQSTGNGIADAIQGVGDATLLANYTFLQTADSVQQPLKHRLQAGVGVKMPIGVYKGVSDREREGLPNMQPGTGSWDVPLNVNYTLRYKNAGINTDASYTITTPNNELYKYGNRLNVQMSAFYWLQNKRCSILPQGGVRYEYALHDYDNYRRKWLNEQTGGYIMSVVAGVQVYYGITGLTIQYGKPVTQQFGGGNITASQRVDVGFILIL